MTRRYVFFVEIAGAAVAVFGAILLVFADVNTWSTVKRAWNDLIGNIQLLHENAKKSIKRTREPNAVHINEANPSHQQIGMRRAYSLDPVLTVPDWSKTGSFKSVMEV